MYAPVWEAKIRKIAANFTKQSPENPQVKNNDVAENEKNFVLIKNDCNHKHIPDGGDWWIAVLYFSKCFMKFTVDLLS
jgi:hypothetical protein